MGAWGLGNFENDDALDWVFELQSAKDLSVVVETFDQVIESSEGYVDAWESAIALAAAEVVAALAGQPAAQLPDEVLEWVKGYTSENKAISLDASVVNKAKQAVTIILTNSELQELWEETEEYDQWESVIADLQKRLG
jgi:hypothetical protein